MKRRPPATDDNLAMERGVTKRAAAVYELRLYVTAGSTQSTRAIINLRHFCQEHLEGRHRLEIINLRERPELAAREGIIAAPTMVKLRPLPLRRIIGDMSNRERLLAGLGLATPTTPQHPVSD